MSNYPVGLMELRWKLPCRGLGVVGREGDGVAPCLKQRTRAHQLHKAIYQHASDSSEPFQTRK